MRTGERTARIQTIFPCLRWIERSDIVNYWITTDTHFGHEKMHEYCQRPDDYEEQIFRNLKYFINDDDILIHLGDFCIYKDEYWHERFWKEIAGNHWLIKGNHDRKSYTWYLSRGWDVVAERLDMKLFGKNIVFTHIPITNLKEDEINIHGHFHNTNHHPENVTTEQHKCLFLEHHYDPFNLRKVVGQ